MPNWNTSCTLSTYVFKENKTLEKFKTKNKLGLKQTRNEKLKFPIYIKSPRCRIQPKSLYIPKSCGEVSLVEQDTIEYVSQPMKNSLSNPDEFLPQNLKSGPIKKIKLIIGLICFSLLLTCPTTAQISILFHKNCSPRDLCRMTYTQQCIFHKSE